MRVSRLLESLIYWKVVLYNEATDITWNVMQKDKNKLSSHNYNIMIPTW